MHPVSKSWPGFIMNKYTYTLLGCLFCIPTQASENVRNRDNSTAETETEAGMEANENKIGATDTSRVFNLDEVVVVSQPKEQASLRKQPLSSSVFTGRDLNRLGVRDLSALSSYVPSFIMPSYGSRLTSSMYIRGIGSRVNSPAVGIYVDGLPLVCKGAFNFHSYQTARVDVLRGPQGTLYGMNTEGGLVRMYSLSPMAHQGTDITIGAGTHFYRNAEFAHYNKLSDKLAFSVAGFYNGQNGFFRNTTTGLRSDGYNEAGGKGRLIFKPNEGLIFDFIADYQYVNQNGFPYGELSLETGDVAAPASGRMNKYRRNVFNTGLNFGYEADAFALNSTTSYQYMNDRMRMDQDYLPADYMHMEQNQLMNAITQELTLKNKTEGAWHSTTGVYGSYQWLKTDAPVFFDDDFTNRIASPVQTIMYNAMVKSMASKLVMQGMPQAMAEKQAAAIIDKAGGVSLNVALEVPSVFRTPQFNLGFYHESNVNITDRLTATLGLRYDYNHVSIDYDARAAMTFSANVMGQKADNVLSSTLLSGTDNDYNQLLPKVALSYALTDDGRNNIYATVCKGYRAGGYNIQMFSDILQTELNANRQQGMAGSYDVPHTADDYDKVNKTIAYKPEVSWNYEAGAHLSLFNDMVHADLSVYYMQIKNQQLSVMAGNYGFGRMMVNAGRSYSLGFEAALRGSAFANRLSWSAGYGLTRAVFKDYNDEIDGVKVDYKGKRVPFIPMHTLNARADYKIDFTAGSAVKSLIIGADVTANGRIYWNEANTYSQPFYALLGAHADVLLGDFELKLWCRNLTDTHYNTFAFDSAASGSTKYFAQRGYPIQAGFDLKLHF